jgi:hypothetical protein
MADQWPADKVERRPVAELVPYARNARTHSPEQISQSLDEMQHRYWQYQDADPRRAFSMARSGDWMGLARPCLH